LKVLRVGESVIRLIPENRKEKLILADLFEHGIQFKTPFLDRSRRISKLDIILKGVK